jgi:CHAD domain-containing protein
MWQEQGMNPSRDDLEETARRALAAARDPRKAAAAAAAAGTAAAAARFGINRMRDGKPPGYDSDIYRLLPGEPVSAGIKRVVAARVDDAIGQLRGEAGTEPAEAVHEARKDIKKIRSALRLVRDEIGDDVWQRENSHYRECARQLSGFRDAEILVEALDGLAERFGPTARERFDRLRAELERENRAAHDDGSIERAMATAAAQLESGRPRIESLPLEGDGWGLIAPGIHRSYRRGRKRLRTVEEEASVENLHELRKRVKDLWYQLRLTRDADPGMLGPLADHAHDLSDHLGDDHDLALLREEVQRRGAAFGDPPDRRHLLEEIDQGRGELQFAAISLGERIYSEKPKRFTKELGRRWEQWRSRKPVKA